GGEVMVELALVAIENLALIEQLTVFAANSLVSGRLAEQVQSATALGSMYPAEQIGRGIRDVFSGAPGFVGAPDEIDQSRQELAIGVLIDPAALARCIANGRGNAELPRTRLQR